MAVQNIGIDKRAKEKLKDLANKNGVSMQGLVGALINMACGDAEHLGIIDIEWRAMRKECPSYRLTQRKAWDAVIKAVETLLEETTDPKEIAQRSRFTLAQVERAITQIKGNK